MMDSMPIRMLQFGDYLADNPVIDAFREHSWLIALLILLFGYPVVKLLIRELDRFFARVELDETVEIFTRRVVAAFLWVILLVMVLDYLGVNITGLLAALGIAGLAIAFAAQDSLSNVFSGIFIMLDRPFKIGDRILLPTRIGRLYSSWGDVVDIGLRSTRVRSTDGVILTIPNRLLTSNTLVNFSHMKEPALRVRIRLGLVPVWSNVARAEELVARLANEHPEVQQKPRPPQVVLRDIRESDVVMELRFYVQTPRQMRTAKSELIKDILKTFEAEGIKIAYPVHVALESRVEPEALGLEGF